jgi:AcrR family transcriptional regulator
MELKTTNTEQLILETAEKLFLERGYTGVSCMEIAKEAGVNHALLHYYFRTKEKLFNQIFEQKATQLLGFFAEAFDRDLPFFEKVKIGIEMHFDFLVQQPELPLFVLREVVQNKERKEQIIQKAFPVGQRIYKIITPAIEEEVKKGVIRPVKAIDLLLNIASLNVFAFVAVQVFFDIKSDGKSAAIRQFLAQRKKNNVETIIQSLKI